MSLFLLTKAITGILLLGTITNSAVEHALPLSVYLSTCVWCVYQ